MILLFVFGILVMKINFGSYNFFLEHIITILFKMLFSLMFFYFLVRYVFSVKELAPFFGAIESKVKKILYFFVH
jgi:hypothetical protein